MKAYKTSIIVLSALFIFISVVMLVYNFVIIKEVRYIPMYFKLEDKMGVNVDKESLNFGKSYPGTTTERNINVQNPFDYPLYLSIKIAGNISRFTSVSDNNFVLEPHEEKKVVYYVTTEEDTQKGHYSGHTTIVMNRALFTAS